MTDYSHILDRDTKLTLSCFPDMTAAQTDKVLTAWAENEYENTVYGHQQAQAELLRLCRWESMSETQREQESERLREG